MTIHWLENVHIVYILIHVFNLKWIDFTSLLIIVTIGFFKNKYTLIL